MHRPSMNLIAVLVFLASSLALPAGAMQLRTSPAAVVELFTSQGCPRCPEADLHLARLGARDDVVALAYHVDYWDYAGWEDTFALPGNAELQRAYALNWGKNRIYTPQMVVNGGQGVVGTQVEDVEALIESAHLSVPIDLRPRGNEAVELHAGANPDAQAAVIWLVTFRTASDVTIERGENSGRTLQYSHIVTGRQAIGMWDPLIGAEMVVPLSEALGRQSDGAAILIQEKNDDLPGAVLGAALIQR